MTDVQGWITAVSVAVLAAITLLTFLGSRRG